MSIKISIKKSPYDREERVSDKDIDMFGRYMKQKKGRRFGINAWRSKYPKKMLISEKIRLLEKYNREKLSWHECDYLNTHTDEINKHNKNLHRKIKASPTFIKGDKNCGKKPKEKKSPKVSIKKSRNKRSDIGDFEILDTTHGIKFLQNGCGTVEDALSLINEIKPKKSTYHPIEDGFLFYLISDLNGQCKNVIDYCEKKYTEMDQKLFDFKCVLSEDCCKELISDELFIKLKTIFNGSIDEIIIRRIETDDTPRCIAFHTDYSSRTLQLCLHSEHDYEGGRLVFVKKDGFHKPSRTLGSVTVHDNQIIHGVTALTKGIRYSLFFLQM